MEPISKELEFLWIPSYNWKILPRLFAFKFIWFFLSDDVYMQLMPNTFNYNAS